MAAAPPCGLSETMPKPHTIKGPVPPPPPCCGLRRHRRSRTPLYKAQCLLKAQSGRSGDGGALHPEPRLLFWPPHPHTTRGELLAPKEGGCPTCGGSIRLGDRMGAICPRKAGLGTPRPAAASEVLPVPPSPKCPSWEGRGSEERASPTRVSYFSSTSPSFFPITIHSTDPRRGGLSRMGGLLQPHRLPGRH